MPTPFQTFRWSRALWKRLGIQGGIPLVLVEDVAPMVQVFDLNAPEAKALLLEERWARRGLQAAVAGQFGSVALTNPVGSGKLVVVELYRNWSTTVACAVFLLGPLGSGGHILTPLDTRIVEVGIDKRSTATVSTQSNAVALASTTHVFDFANSNAGAGNLGDPSPGIVLSPGNSIVLEGLAVNQAVEATFRWREIVPAAQELTLSG